MLFLPVAALLAAAVISYRSLLSGKPAIDRQPAAGDLQEGAGCAAAILGSSNIVRAMEGL